MNRGTPVGSRLFGLCYGKRPAEELYDSEADPDQFENLAGHPGHAEIVRQLRSALVEFQERTGDPRAKAGPTEWDELPGQLGPPFLFPEFLPADNEQRVKRLKERFFSKGKK